MSLIAVILGAVGAILSVFKTRWCFVVWMPCNVYWIWFNYPGVQSYVFLVMTFSCMVGWWTWGLDSKDMPALRTMNEKLLAENYRLRTYWTQAQDTIIKLNNQIKELESV